MINETNLKIEMTEMADEQIKRVYQDESGYWVELNDGYVSLWNENRLKFNEEEDFSNVFDSILPEDLYQELVKEQEKEKAENQKDFEKWGVIDETEGQKIFENLLSKPVYYTRDTNLSEELTGMYQVGAIIEEPNELEVTFKNNAVPTTHRFTIVSSLIHESTDKNDYQRYGICQALPYSHFKVLDKYESEGKTQILLFHLPYGEEWNYFRFLGFDEIEQFTIEDARANFDRIVKKKAVVSQRTKEWLDRCSRPIGFVVTGDDLTMNFIL